MSNIILRRYLGRSQLAESLVVDELAEHRDAVFARDVEELVIECLELEKMSKGAWDYVLKLLFADETDEIDELGQMMKMATTKIIAVFDRVAGAIEEAKRGGHPLRDEVDFQIAHREIQKLRADVEQKFPPVNEELAKRSLEAFKRGDWRTAEEMLHESQSQGSS
jgi:hypothetical protein